MSATYCGQAGSRGRGLFSSRDCRVGELLCLGAPHAAAQVPGNTAAVCASCGRFLSKRIVCCCPAAYCSKSCRDHHAMRGHALLCPGACPGDAAAQLAELLECGGDAALFLPLAVQWVAATAAEAARGNRRRVMEAARQLVASMAAGGPWVEVGGARAVPGHFPEEEEEGEGEGEEEGEEEEEGGESGEEGEEEGEEEGGEEEGGEEEEEEGAEAQVAVLLPHCWRLLLETLEARLPPAAAPRLLRQLRSHGASWLGSLVGALERSALPASAPPPASAGRGGRREATGLEAMVFLPQAALLNHSCVPNCAVAFGGGGGGGWEGWGSVSLLLLRDVAAEEELLASYVDAAAPLRERAAALRAMHGFVCRCERCGVQRAAAGARRRLRLAAREGGGGGATAAAAAAALVALTAVALRALEGGLYEDAVALHRSLLRHASRLSTRGGEAGWRGAPPSEPSVPPGRLWRGDVSLRLGGALQRLHRFDEARRLWCAASAACPEHAGLRREAETAAAYRVTCLAPPSQPGLPPTLRPSKRARDEAAPAASPPHATALPPRLAAAPSVSPGLELAAEGVGEAGGGGAGGERRVFLSARPVISPASCAAIIRACEEHVAACGGWSTQRHTSVPTTDLEVRSVEAVRRCFVEALGAAVFPFLEEAYAACAPRGRTPHRACCVHVHVPCACACALCMRHRWGLLVRGMCTCMCTCRHVSRMCRVQGACGLQHASCPPDPCSPD